MREIMLTALTQRKDETGVSYEKISTRIEQKRGVYISVSKLQRIFTGQQEPTVQDYEMIAEAGLEMDLDKTYAKVGKQEVHDSEALKFDGAKALMDKFAEEKALIHKNYETRITALVEQSDKRQQAFTDALTLIGEQGDKSQKAFTDALALISDQYRVNADYLTGVIIDNEAYIRDLLTKTEHANAIAMSEKERAEEAEKKIKELDKRLVESSKRRFKVFWSMFTVVILLLAVIVISVVFDLPAFNWGNTPR